MEEKENESWWKSIQAHKAIKQERMKYLSRRKLERKAAWSEGKKLPDFENQRWICDRDTNLYRGVKQGSLDMESFVPMKQKDFDKDSGIDRGSLNPAGRFARSQLRLARSKILRDAGNNACKPKGGEGETECGIMTRSRARNNSDIPEIIVSHASSSGRWQRRKPQDKSTGSPTLLSRSERRQQYGYVTHNKFISPEHLSKGKQHNAAQVLQEMITADFLSTEPQWRRITPMSRRRKMMSQHMFSHKKGTPSLSQRRLQTQSTMRREQHLEHTTHMTQSATHKEVVGQMCCRALQFENGNKEGEEMEEEYTEPLSSMNATPIISKASVLKAPFNQEQQPKGNLQPFIKKNLLQQPTTRIKMINRNYNLRNSKTREGVKQMRLVSNKPSNVALAGLSIHTAHSNTGQEMSKDKPILKETMNGPQGLGNHITKEVPNQTNYYSLRKGKTVKKGKPARVVARRSIPVYSQPPASTNLEVNKARTTSKIPNHPTTRTTSGRPAQRRSLAHSSVHIQESQQSQNISDVVTNLESTDESEEDKVVRKVGVDASTNTTLKFTGSCSPDPQIKHDVQTLLDQMELIEAEAKAVWERTCARRREMEESGLLQSMTTTVSPLKRLRVWLQEQKDQCEVQNDSSTLEDMGSHSSTTDNTKAREMEEDPSLLDINSGLMYTTPNTSMEECSSLNTTYNPNHTSLNTSQMHYSQLKCDYKFLQTPVFVAPRRFRLHTSIQEEEEKMDEEAKEEFQAVPPKNNNQSPFTQLVGDCERPSLAPMTPHSRQHVSLLKLSLQKQLDDLYN